MNSRKFKKGDYVVDLKICEGYGDIGLVIRYYQVPDIQMSTAFNDNPEAYYSLWLTGKDRGKELWLSVIYMRLATQRELDKAMVDVL